MLLRFATAADAAEIAAIYAPVVEHTAISFETVAPDAAEIRSRIAGMPADKPYLVAEHRAGWRATPMRAGSADAPPTGSAPKSRST